MANPEPFSNRVEAGRRLAEALSAYERCPGTLVLGIARGGMPVAYEVAVALDAPLDVLVVRKLGLPEQPELALGAIAAGGIRILNQRLISELGVPASVIETVTRKEQQELERRERVLRGRLDPIDPAGRTVILVDDGLATGATLRAAIAAVRRRGATRVVVAVPVAQTQVCASISKIANETICLLVADRFVAVGQWYLDFSATTDEEVRRLLESAARRMIPAA